MCFPSQGAGLEVLGEFSQPSAVAGSASSLELVASPFHLVSLQAQAFMSPHGLITRTLRLDWVNSS